VQELHQPSESTPTAAPLTPLQLQHRLIDLNKQRFSPTACGAPPTAGATVDAAESKSFAQEMHLRRLENRFIDVERRAVAAEVAAAPVGSDEAFLEWFEHLKETGAGQHDPLFAWLAEDATLAQMCWFLSQEMAGEAGFDDLVALTQVRLPDRPKLELARNYWDEMGRGHMGAMHGPMLHRLSTHLQLELHPPPSCWEALAVGNLLSALAANRSYTYQSLGALGVVELTAPARCAQISAGLRRLGVDPQARQYYAIHATMDIKHSEAWNAEVLRPLLQDAPQLGTTLAEGALLRLRAGARAFARYRHMLWEEGATHTFGSPAATPLRHAAS
jgi:hypothetical protein